MPLESRWTLGAVSVEKIVEYRNDLRSRGRERRSRRSARSVIFLLLLAAFGVGAGVALISIGGAVVGEALVQLTSDASPCKIKGDISVAGDRIYYVPGHSAYDRAMISTRRGERWFCSEKFALDAGWRKAAE